MGALLQDLRFAARSLRKQPGMTAIAIACLALGIGANTAIFSVVRTVLLGALPYRAPDGLVRVYESVTIQGKSGLTGSASVPNLLDWREQNRSFEGLAAYQSTNKNLLGVDEPERLVALEATATLFDLLGTRPIAGRTFGPNDDQSGQPAVAILSEALWKTRFGRRADIVGSTIRLDSTVYSVIGVMPASFDFPIGTVHTDVWTPLVFAGNTDSPSRGSHWVSVIGRLKPGVTVAAAAADMSGIAARLLRAYPGDMAGRGALVVPMQEVLVRLVRPALLVLLGAVGLVLLIACANVANLLLARATTRRREVAIRTALGADRRRIVRQFLTESVLLAACGGVLGVGVAAISLRAILTLAATSLPRSDSIGLDPAVLTFTAALAVATGIAFGLAPALQASRANLRQDLTDSSGKASTGARQHRALKSLIVGEIALSLVLLTGAGLLVRSFAALLHTDPGLDARNVLTFRTRVVMGAYPDSTPYARFYGPALDRVRAVHGVRGAGIINLLPIQSAGMNGNFVIIGQPEDPDPTRRPWGEFRIVSSGYFKALAIPLVKGREFVDGDIPGSQPVLLINQEFARRYFPNQDPIGQRMRAWSPAEMTIVGVVGDVHQAGLDQEARSEVYVNAAQNPQRLGNMTFAVSTSASPTQLVPAVRAAVRAVSPEQPLFAVESMETVIDDSLQARKLVLVLLVVLASLAITLSAAGVYGVMSYSVSQRTREIGIRMALGANGRSVTAMVLRDAALLAGTGVVAGLVGATVLSRFMESQLYGVTARDPVTLAIATLILPIVAIASSAIPALRASRADPLVAIRAE